jgi:hypothetical protein
MRLGLALTKSQSEIRAMPYPDYRDWQLMYMLEPWGWPDREFRMAAILAKINNAFISKSSQAKKPDYYMRDMEKGLLDKLAELKTENHVEDMDPEERKAYLIKNMKAFFGA